MRLSWRHLLGNRCRNHLGSRLRLDIHRAGAREVRLIPCDQEMKGAVRMIMKILLGLAVVTLFAAVAAAPALASPKWQTCTESTSGKGEWCLKVGEGNFESKEIRETEEVTSSTSGLELEDEKATGGASKIKCKGGNLGWIGANGQDGIIKATAKECERVTGPCEAGTARAIAINLPWGTTLEEETNGIRDKIRAGGSGPGYEIECRVAGFFKIVDTCTGTTSAKITNNENIGIVEDDFETKSGKDTCSIGGADAGNMRGVEIIKLKLPLFKSEGNKNFHATGAGQTVALDFTGGTVTCTLIQQSGVTVSPTQVLPMIQNFSSCKYGTRTVKNFSCIGDLWSDGKFTFFTSCVLEIEEGGAVVCDLTIPNKFSNGLINAVKYTNVTVTKPDIEEEAVVKGITYESSNVTKCGASGTNGRYTTKEFLVGFEKMSGPQIGIEVK